MILKQLSEIVFKYYQGGKVSTDKQAENYSQQDILQLCKSAAANYFRQQYVSSTIVVQGKRISVANLDPDYYFSSPLLSIKRFVLPDSDVNGLRRADMNGFDLFRLPKNAHFTNMYLVNNKCDGQDIGSITQVQNGEEKFYLKPKFRSFQFYSVVGTGINTYNVPHCIKFIDIETTYESEDSEITLDACYEVANEVLGLILKIKSTTGDFEKELKEQLKKQEDIK